MSFKTKDLSKEVLIRLGNIWCEGGVGRIKDHNRSGPTAGHLNYSLSGDWV